MTYEGQMKDSAMSGEGRITHLDSGNVYEGEFDDNMKSGKGRFLHYGFTEGRVLSSQEIEER